MLWATYFYARKRKKKATKMALKNKDQKTVLIAPRPHVPMGTRGQKKKYVLLLALVSLRALVIFLDFFYRSPESAGICAYGYGRAVRSPLSLPS